MASTGKKWLIGCGAGCGLVIVLNIVFMVGAGIMVTRPMNKAVDSQEALQEATGPADAFRPGLDSLDRSRIEAFLRVRESLMDHCAKLEDVASGFEAMEEVDEKEDPSFGEIMHGLGKVMVSVKGVVVELGAVLGTRNKALIAEDMNLGEYTWIYILSYYSYLEKTPETGVEDEGGSLQHDDRRLMETFMRRHAEALLQAGRDTEAEQWNEAAEHLDWEDSGVPFAGLELPAEVVSAMEPYRDLLEITFCAPLADMDLGEIQKKGFSFHAH